MFRWSHGIEKCFRPVWFRWLEHYLTLTPNLTNPNFLNSLTDSTTQERGLLCPFALTPKLSINIGTVHHRNVIAVFADQVQVSFDVYAFPSNARIFQQLLCEIAQMAFGTSVKVYCSGSHHQFSNCTFQAQDYLCRDNFE